jgi:hypothetical protein
MWRERVVLALSTWALAVARLAYPARECATAMSPSSKAESSVND